DRRPRRALGLLLRRRSGDRHRPHAAAEGEDRGQPILAPSPRHRLGRGLPVRSVIARTELLGAGALRVALVVTSVAAAGALATLGVGLAVGMHPDDVAHLGLLLLPAIAATVVAMVVARPLLARAAIRQSLIGVAAIAAIVGILNLVVLTRQMFVSHHDATQVAVLLIYSLGAGLGAAWGLARSQTSAVERLAVTARQLGEGNLDARVGSLE